MRKFQFHRMRHRKDTRGATNIKPGKTFLNQRLTFRLDVLANETIAYNDHAFVNTVGCNIREIRVLRIVDDIPGITFMEIVAATRLERSLVSRIIQRLLALDLIIRRNQPDDARRYQLFTTDSGKERRKQARKLADELEEILFSPLGRKQSEELSSALEKLALWVHSDEYREAIDAYVQSRS